MMQDQEEIIFSELYNDDRFSSEEKAFLGRLYEIFFQIPGFLKSEYESTGRIPVRREIAAGFGISLQSVDLLLAVMETDPRVPLLFERNPQTQEIGSLELDNINAFIGRRGNTVKVTQWEGEGLPPFELTSFQNEKLRSQDLVGKNILIYFWFTGCPPCIRIAPILEALDHKYSDSNFQVIGFNADQVIGLEVTDQQRKDYLQEHNLHFVNVQVDQPTREAFGNINVFPTLFLVDSDRTIFRHMINYQDQETLESVIRELIQAG
ncbi:TlpA family protein disulfide reductase [Acidobacteria bacterium AH-259-D05]|nr:TlpA family protein disulfide reductase [Acidobacteria bacterium AH-259-D05]